MRFVAFILLMFLTAYGHTQARFDFEKTTLKFPKTRAGEVLHFEYSFTNTGNQPLVISEIKVQCSCTKFEFPKEPVRPGEKATIKVTFDTKDKYGYQDRTLEVYSNAGKNPFRLRFKVVVDEKHAGNAQH